MLRRRIDVHQHIVPPYADWLASQGVSDAGGRVLFGSDWPYAPEVAVSYFTAQLDDYDALDADGHAAVDRRNAEALLPSLAHKEIA